jgi:intracellular sulfur oxidation DsrE/DsrF family protein
MYTRFATVALFAATVGLAFAQSDKPMPVPGSGVAKDVANAGELPDGNTTYKVLFDAAKAAPKPDQANAMLDAVARYVNTLDKWGVSAGHRKVAVIVHQGAGQIILKSDVYKERTGSENPNVALIQALQKAGVEFHVCGQGLLANKVQPDMVLPGVQIDLWALVSIVNFQNRGYAFIGN